MQHILILLAIANIITYAVYAFKEGVKTTDFLIISLYTALLAVIMEYHEELKCLLENFQK